MPVSVTEDGGGATAERGIDISQRGNGVEAPWAWL